MLRPSLAVAFVLTLARPDAPAPAGGRIEGTVVLSRALATRRPKFRIYSDAGQGSTPPAQPAPDLKDEYVNVVLYLESDRGGLLSQGAASSPIRVKPTMTQRDEKFIPHILPVVAGTIVDFPNEDEVFHNVFSLSGPKTFDLPKYPTGASRSVTFNRPGVVHVFCHIHTDMSAVVLILDNPYFIVPDSSGNFAIDGIPPGDYTLVAWHERIKSITQKVRIADGQITRASFNIPLPQPADR